MNGGHLAAAGQHEAMTELRRIERVTSTGVEGSPAGIRVVGANGWEHDNTYLRIDILVDCRLPSDWRPLVALQEAEPVAIIVPPGYPLRQPHAKVEHRRFAGLPHVVWGEDICLHLSPDDWDPARGMQGFMERLVDWFRKVADGTLGTTDVVLEPPLTDTSDAEAVLLVRAELPERLVADEALWTAFAVVEALGDGRYEVSQWLTDVDAIRAEDVASGRSFMAVVLGLPDEVGFSYPRVLGELLDGLEDQGAPRERLWDLFETAREQSDAMWTAESSPDAWPVPMTLLVSPGPRRSSVGSRAAYLAAWSLPAITLTPDEPISWVILFDQRPHYTKRRDNSRPATWLRDKRVLVLGCGGLGAPIAEYCVRAGASSIHLLDSGAVKPGILVRQPYRYAETGLAKAEALAARLAEMTAETSVASLEDDAVDFIMRRVDVPTVDLIVDATASRAVAAALERTRWQTRGPHPPLLSVMVGHDCALGAATLALPGANGAGNDILRRLAITASDDDTLTDLLDDFYPDLPRTELFVPEPGCSDPTYVGSAADLAAFGAWLLNDALTILRAAPHPAAPLRWATVVRSPTAGSRRLVTDRRHWPEALTSVDDRHRYEVRVDKRAFADVRREVLRMSDVRGRDVETGGLLLGQIDHASRVVWVTDAQGLPAGSVAWTEGLRLDPTEARASVEQRQFRTRRLVSFIGEWHTHPRHGPRPSPMDENAMEDLAKSTGSPVLLMIFGVGGGDEWQRWLGGRGRPKWHAQLFFPG